MRGTKHPSPNLYSNRSSRHPRRGIYHHRRSPSSLPSWYATSLRSVHLNDVDAQLSRTSLATMAHLNYSSDVAQNCWRQLNMPVHRQRKIGAANTIFSYQKYNFITGAATPTIQLWPYWFHEYFKLCSFTLVFNRSSEDPRSAGPTTSHVFRSVRQ